MSTMNEPQNEFKLHPDTALAHVELQVKDLPNMTAFYNDLMGFQILESTDSITRLSPTGAPPALLTLVARPDAQLQPSTSFATGLYHTAIRFPDRKALATTLLRILATGWQLQGASDHRVSEAIYLADPEGNGIEIYRDRPRADWPRLQETLQMGNGPLDLRKLIDEADQDAAQAGKINPGADIGHIHLQVSDLATAHAFYHDLLGMDVMMALPTALFLAAGGYHHHVGANTWHSNNAPRRNVNATGLSSYAYYIPQDGWLELLARMRSPLRTLTPVERDGRIGVAVEDQDGIGVELLTDKTPAVEAALNQ
jgi:catechol 2,3-dioxygenase